MTIVNSQLQDIVNDALAGKTLLIQVADQTELNSNKVRLYRIRRSMESKVPDIVNRITISQKSVEGKHFISVGPPKDLPVFVEDDSGLLVKREEVEGRNKELLRLIHLLIKDEIPLDEVKEILRVWPKEAMPLYFRLRQFKDDDAQVQEAWKHFEERESRENGHNSQEA